MIEKIKYFNFFYSVEKTNTINLFPFGRLGDLELDQFLGQGCHFFYI